MAKYQGHKMRQAHSMNHRAAALKHAIYVSLNPGQLPQSPSAGHEAVQPF